MVKNLKTYYDFAENDYQFFMAAYKNGIIGNSMGAMAQEICEKYLKHLVDVYVKPTSLEEDVYRSEILKTHNLNKLFRYLSQNLPELKLDRAALNTVNGLYFTTRYPGEESITISEDDIPEYVQSVAECKKNVDDFIEQQHRREYAKNNAYFPETSETQKTRTKRRDMER